MLLKRIFLFLVGCISFVLLGRLFLHAWTLLFTAHCYDCDVFWAMGRGMLNGLTPYVDLFEAKPPGIFLLSALSLFVGGGRMLGNISAFVVTIFVAVMPCILVWMRYDKRVVLSFLALLFGTIMSYYLSEGSFHYLPEQFGVAFGVAYVCIIGFSQYEESSYFSLLHVYAGFCLFAAIFMKEPFVLSIVAAGLILSSSLWSVVSNVVIPLVIAGVMHICTLVFLGLLRPYFFIYLREMLGWRMQSGVPLWVRPLHLDSYKSMYDLLFRFSPFVLFSLLLLFALFVIYVFWRRNPRDAWKIHTPLILVAVYLAVASIFTSGGYVYNQHHLFILPAFFACFVFLVQRLNETWDHVFSRTVAVVAVVLFCIASFTIPPSHYRPLLSFRDGVLPEKMLAAQVDQILDNCREDQYLYIGLNGHKLFGYTTHSPLGPLLVQYEYFFNENPQQKGVVKNRVLQYQQDFLSSLGSANIVIYDHHNSLGEFKKVIDQYVLSHFSQVPWKCSTTVISKTSGVSIYYRNQ